MNRKIPYKTYPDKLKPDVSSAKASNRITLTNFNITKMNKKQFKKLVKDALVLNYLPCTSLKKKKIGRDIVSKMYCFAKLKFVLTLKI